ncbi:MAG: glutamate mutase L [Spirochaetales bacterium]|nr:glutamate mutase L [Spirochaetales bacterium]
MDCISVDLGSTYTKGGLFSFHEGSLKLVSRATVPTTPFDLSAGFNICIQALSKGTQTDYDIPIVFSSSALGGLRIAALGIVPDVTMKMAKLTALSAGGRVSQVFSYKLTEDDLVSLEQEDPDIILFAGGTDGGNEDYIHHNARVLAGSTLKSSIIYCGNRTMKTEVGKILSGREIHFTANILPALNEPAPEEAREKIREIFLEKIVYGKGLDRIIEKTGTRPVPTPLGMYEYAGLISEHSDEWKEFCMIDMGGATTDFYSSCRESSVSEEVVIRGIREPDIKRTVEGDMGMRINALTVLQTANRFLREAILRTGLDFEEFECFVQKVSEKPDFLPSGKVEKEFDRILASACVSVSAERHAGRVESIYTSGGRVKLQTGKNLSGVKKVIGSGGYLSRINAPVWQRNFIDDKGWEILLPQSIEYYRDEKYLFPLLGNIARLYPDESVVLGIDELKKEELSGFGGYSGNPE